MLEDDLGPLHFISLLRVQLLDEDDDRAHLAPVLANYLADGHVVVLTNARVHNELDRTQPDIAYGYLTDGTWVWSTELAAYASICSLALPAEFVASVESLHGVIPQVPTERLHYIQCLTRGNPSTSHPSTSHPSTSHPSTSHPSTSHPSIPHPSMFFPY